MPPIAGLSPARKAARKDASDDESVSSIPAMPTEPERMEEVVEAAGALTLDVIGKLMATQLAPLTSSVDSVRSDLESFKSTISSSIKAVKGEVAEIRSKVDGVAGTAKEALAIANETENDFEKLKLEMAPADTSAIDKRISVECLEKGRIPHWFSADSQM